MTESYIDVPVNRPVTEELETDVDLGAAETGDDFSAFIGNQPIALRWKDVFAKLGQPIPAEVALYRMFEVWLVPHRFSLNRKKGLAEPTAIGIEVEYVHHGTTCSVISLLPGPRWVKHGGASLHANISGKFSATGEMTEFPGLEMVPGLRIGELGIGAIGGGGIGFSFDWNVATPVISAVGQGSSRCEWRFDRGDEPLFGRTIETWSVLALPKRQKDLEYKMRCYYLRRTLFFPTRCEGEFVTVKCTLAA
jgi:hypothetical protein